MSIPTVDEDHDHTHPTPHPSARATKPLPPQPNRQSNKPPPLPPLKPKQPPVDHGMNYEVPWDMLRQRGDEDCMEDLPADVYESVGALDVDEMNKNPPPIWRRDGGAPISPPSHSPGLKRWTLERKKPSNPSQSQDDLLKSSRSNDLLIKRPLPQEPQKNLDGPQRRLQKPLPPPVKSKPTTTAHAVPGAGMGMGFNIRNDPKFSQKLQERKQIHGGTDAVKVRHNPVTGGEEEDVPQEGYEEILFTASEEFESPNTHVHKSAAKRTAKSVARRTPPSPVMMVENEEGYVDARQAQDYLTFESSAEQRRSRSPMNWEQLLPGKPSLQPRTASMMRERDSHDTQNGEEPPTTDPPLPPRGPTSMPKLKKPLPTPPGPLKRERSTHPSHPRPTSTKVHTVARVSSQSPEPVASMKRRDSTPTSPPPLPSRDPITVPNPSVPKRYPASRNKYTQSQSADSPPPKPDSGIFEVLTFGSLPADQTNTDSTQPQTSLHRRVSTREHEESPPPIPRRHPMASGKHTPDITSVTTTKSISQQSPSPDNVDKNPLPLPPRGYSPLEDGRPSSISPPVPPRDPTVPQRLSTQSRHVTDDGSSRPLPPVPSRSASDSGVTQNNVESQRLPVARRGRDPNSASPERHMTSHTHKTKPVPPPKPLPTARKPPPAVLPRPRSFRNGHSVSNNPDNTQVGIARKPKPLPPPKLR